MPFFLTLSALKALWDCKPLPFLSKCPLRGLGRIEEFLTSKSPQFFHKRVEIQPCPPHACLLLTWSRKTGVLAICWDHNCCHWVNSLPGSLEAQVWSSSQALQVFLWTRKGRVVEKSSAEVCDVPAALVVPRHQGCYSPTPPSDSHSWMTAPSDEHSQNRAGFSQW